MGPGAETEKAVNALYLILLVVGFIALCSICAVAYVDDDTVDDDEDPWSII